MNPVPAVRAVRRCGARVGALAVVPALLPALLALACDRGGGNRQSVVEQAVAIAPEIERATGLKFTRPPRVEVRTREQVRAFVTRVLDEPDARAELAGLQAAYRRLGALSDSADLRAITARLLGEQVAGFYDPRSKTLYVVQGADSQATSVTLRHELVHALQDQHQNLDSLLRLRGQADRAVAAQAAVEGQAVWTQLGGGTDLTSRVPGGWERVRALIRDNAQRSPEVADAPLVVREGLLFPYLSGAELARAAALAGRPDAAFRRLPASTEQVLHTERFLTRPDPPVTVTLPAPRGGQVVAENTLGEFDTRLVLYEQLEDLGRAARAAAGWGGDRWAAVRVDGGDAFVWVTVLDTPVDAAELFEALAEFVPKRFPGARAEGVARPAAAPAAGARGGGARARGAAAAGAPAPAVDSGRARAFAVPDAPGGARRVTVRAADVAGRPAVVYEDVPAAVSGPLVDVARVTAAVGAADAAPPPAGAPARP